MRAVAPDLEAIGALVQDVAHRVVLPRFRDLAAGEIAEKSPTTLRFLKQSFNADTDHQAGLSNLAMSALDLITHSPEGLEGANAFAEKRTPQFNQYVGA